MSPLAIKSTFRLCYPKILVQIGNQDLQHDVIKLKHKWNVCEYLEEIVKPFTEGGPPRLCNTK